VRALAWLAVLLVVSSAAGAADGSARIGSKFFTESVILGELLRLDAERHALTIEHHRAMGGSAILWQALLEGGIDAYPEYTGTLTQELLHDLPQPVTRAALIAALQTRGIGMSAPLGFEDRYALGVSQALADKLHLQSLSDLQAQPQVRYALSNEFMSRADGWQGLRRAYALTAQNVKGIDHTLAYRALGDGAADVIDLYTTDAEIQSYHVQVLADDRHFFPGYEAVFLYRLESAQRMPALAQSIADFDGRISESAMQRMNAAVQIQRQEESSVAAQFLATLTSDASGAKASGAATASMPTFRRSGMKGIWGRIGTRTLEHLQLVGISVALALLLGLPLGLAAAKLPGLGRWVLAIAVVLQTVPTLAMLVFMIPVFGIGARPAIATLFLYGLLPIVRNTLTGLASIPASLKESAASLGLPWQVQVLRVEAPLAARTIIAGVSTAAVISVGTATLGALIGAGGYGEPILTGIRLNDLPLILEGAIPAALLALVVMALFQGIEHWLTPRGLRLSFDG